MQTILNKIKYALLTIVFIAGNTIVLQAAERYNPSILTKNSINYDSYVVIDGLLDEIFSVLGDKTLSPEDYNSIISAILDKNFAVKYMSIWVIANYRDKMTYDLLERYYNAFRQYVILYYGSLVHNYSGQTMLILDVQQKNENTAVVTVSIETGTSEPILIDWTLRRSKNDPNSPPYIVDISLSGISLLATQRAEYETIIRKNNRDLEKFVTILENKVEELTKKVLN